MLEQVSLLIVGTNLPSNISYISIGEKTVKVTSASQTQISFITPSLPPGLYDVVIQSSYGKAT